jgi:hypothetical protein
MKGEIGLVLAVVMLKQVTISGLARVSRTRCSHLPYCTAGSVYVNDVEPDLIASGPGARACASVKYQIVLLGASRGE